MAPSGARAPLRRIALIAVAALLAAAGSARALDLTNTWVVTLFGVTCRWTLTQTGSDLTMGTGPGCGRFRDPLRLDGTVDSATGAFTAAGIVAYLFPPYPSPPIYAPMLIQASAAPDGAAFSGTAEFLSTLEPIAGTLCGNGNLDPDEECDDGLPFFGCCNDACRDEPDGQPCSIPPHDQCVTNATCTAGACVGTPKPAGTLCEADNDLCTFDECDGAGACTSTRSPCCSGGTAYCARPGGRRNRFLLETNIPDANDRVVFHLRGAVGEGATDFGDPTTGGDYALCVWLFDDWDAVYRLVLAPQVPAGGTCGTAPCWKVTPKGFGYHDRLRTPNGVQALRLRGEHGKAALGIVGGGANLSPRSYPISWPRNQPLLVEIVTRDHCWAAWYASPTIETGLIEASGGE
jgi:hypothetical protein